MTLPAPPTRLYDFDHQPGLPRLKRRSHSPGRSVWTPSWGLNFMFSLLTLALAIPFAMTVLHADRALAWIETLRVWQQALVGLITVVAALTTLLFASESITRCRLVVDRTRGEIRYTSGVWFWRRYCLRMNDVREVRRRTLERHLGDDGAPIRNRIVFTQLWSGEFVLLAVDPNRRSPNLYREIKQAVEAHLAIDTHDVS